MNNTYYESSKQLCWNCKRCTNSAEFNCPWSEKGEPIEGWTAFKGKDYYHKDPLDNKKKYMGYSYEIIECPLYVKDKEYTKKSEVVSFVSNKLGVSTTIVYKKYKEYLKLYEDKFGEKLPAWVWYEDV